MSTPTKSYESLAMVIDLTMPATPPGERNIEEYTRAIRRHLVHVLNGLPYPADNEDARWWWNHCKDQLTLSRDLCEPCTGSGFTVEQWPDGPLTTCENCKGTGVQA